MLGRMGFDYFDTLSPVAKLTSIKLFVSIATSYSWPLHQLDIFFESETGLFINSNNNTRD